jgi:zinc transporter ZupT
LNAPLDVLLSSTLAASAAAQGVIPVAWRGSVPLAWIGWSNALASGLMLGVAYSLMVTGLEQAAIWGGVGALLGIAFVHLSHAATGTAEMDLNRLDEPSPEYGFQVNLVNALHAAHEGVAIGVGMAVSLPFGILMALALAVHNIPEAAIQTTIVTKRGARLRDAAALAVVTNVNQILLAIVSYSVLEAGPGLLPWAVGFAVGALIYLVMVELLPESYREAGHTSIAVVTVVAMGMVVLLTAQPT